MKAPILYRRPPSEAVNLFYLVIKEIVAAISAFAYFISHAMYGSNRSAKYEDSSTATMTKCLMETSRKWRAELRRAVCRVHYVSVGDDAEAPVPHA